MFSTNPVTALQAFFVLTAATILLVNAVPALRYRFVTYGSRATPLRAQHGVANGTASNTKASPSQSDMSDSPPRSHVFRTLIDKLGEVKVPHDYFKHFYVVSVASSLFWLYHIMARTSFLARVCASCRGGDSSRIMSIDQVLLTWSLMMVQGGRRLYESFMLSKPSSSKMWFVHWLLGMVFYLAMGVAVWVEGANQLLGEKSAVHRINFSAPSIRTMLSLPIFIIASGIQHDCHAYLASLPKYTLPVHPIFNTFVCPHYAAECLIYLSLAMISAPSGAWVNRTILTAFIFVTVNLSVTAASTKEWYEEKFGKEKVARRWTMVPGIW